MSIKLRQSTASQEIPLGIFLDETDGKTPETALSIANTDIKLWKMGATAIVNKTSGGAVHMANGIYSTVLDATDTNTQGGLVVFVQVAGALPVRFEAEILPANVYDSLIAGTDRLETDAMEISGDLAAAAALELEYDATPGAVPGTGIIDRGTAQSATSTTLVLRAAAAFATSELVGSIIVITGGTTGVGQSRAITAYSGTTDTATVEAWTTTPTGTITYEVYACPVGTSGSGSGLDAAGVRAAVGLASANLDTQLSSISTNATTAVTDTTNIKTRLPTALVSGRIDASVGAMATDTITATALATSAVTEINTAPLAALVTLQADTDDIQTRLPAALVSGRIDASVGAMAANTMTAAAAAADLTTELQTGLATSAALGTAQTAITNIQSRIPTALVSGRIDASVGAMAASTMTASALATDAVAEIQTGLVTSTDVTTLTTNVSAIKTKTDQLAFTGGRLDANLDATERTAVATALLDLGNGIETSLSVRQALRGIAAVLLGVSSEDLGVWKFRNVADTKDVITATVNNDKERTAVTRDFT